MMQEPSAQERQMKSYCEWLIFRGVPIFVVFVEGPIHEFQYPWISDSLYELWRKILWPRIMNPTNVSFSVNPQKLVPTKLKPSTVFLYTPLLCCIIPLTDLPVSNGYISLLAVLVQLLAQFLSLLNKQITFWTLNIMIEAQI